MTATLYAVLALLPITLQIALMLGAPLGRFSVGGRFPHRLPPLWRVLAGVQALVLASMAAAVLDRGGVIALGWPPVAFWLAVAATILSGLANAASPSRPERLLWTPVTALMALAALSTALS